MSNNTSNITLISPVSTQQKKLKERYGKIDFDRKHVRWFSLSPKEASVYFFGVALLMDGASEEWIALICNSVYNGRRTGYLIA